MPFSRIRVIAAALLICGAGGAAVAPRGIAALAYAGCPGLSRRATGEVVTLEDGKAQTVVSIILSSGNKAFEMKVKGQNV